MLGMQFNIFCPLLAKASIFHPVFQHVFHTQIFYFLCETLRIELIKSTTIDFQEPDEW